MASGSFAAVVAVKDYATVAVGGNLDTVFTNAITGSTVTVYTAATKDTVLQYTLPSSNGFWMNYGARTASAGTSSETLLIQFDLSLLPGFGPGAVINKAELRLHQSSGNTGTYEVRYVATQNWSEGNKTGAYPGAAPAAAGASRAHPSGLNTSANQNADGSAGSSSSGSWGVNGDAQWSTTVDSTIVPNLVDKTLSGGFYVWAVTDIVNSWAQGTVANRGFVIQAPSSYNRSLHFSEYGATNANYEPVLFIDYTPAQVAAPAFSPVPGSYGSAQSVTITTSTGGATIRYTTDGSTPTSSYGTVYSGPVNISTTTTLKAIAYKSGWTDSTVTSGTYTISAPANTIRIVRTGTTYASIQAAHDAAIAGDTIEISSGTYVGSTVWTEITKANLTIRGVGATRPVLDSNYEVKNSKGLFVTTSTGTNLTVENLELRNAYSLWAANAACIRLQSAGLTVRNCYLHHGSNGILSQGYAGSNVLLEYCEFAWFGTGAGQEHNLYIGGEDTLTMRYCYSHNCNAGHLVKTRAKKNYILYNRLGNANGQASYEVNIPSAGESYVIGNLIYQASTTANSTIIDYLSEYPNTGNPGLPEPNSDWHLYVINNTIVNDKTGAVFVRNGYGTLDNTDADTNPNYFPIALVQNNIFAGPGTAVSTAAAGTTTQLNNWSTTVAGAYLAWVSMFDYRLTASSTGAVNLGGNPGTSHTGYSLTPTQQYVHPFSYQARPTNGTIDIGAYEYVSPPANQAPSVNAGLDQITTVPRYTVNLDATVSDDITASPTVLWTKVSGPGTVTFGNSALVDTTATFSATGTYVLQLQATDGSGLFTTDTVGMTVNPDPALGGTLTFQNGVIPDATYVGCEDNFMSSNYPTTNYGNYTWDGRMGVYAGTNRSVIRFNVSAIPSSKTVTSAKLRLFIRTNTTNSLTVEAYQVLRAWTKTGSTWNNYASGLAWTTAGCGGVGTDRAATAAGSLTFSNNPALRYTWIEIPLSVSLVQGWVNGSIANNGLLLKEAAEASYYTGFHVENFTDISMDPGSDLLCRPQLVVVFN